MTSKRAIKSAFESMLFVWGQPLDVKLAAEIFNINWKEAYNCFLELQEEYERQQRGIRIREVNKSFQFVTCEENIALEVLAIIAYKQPVTKGEIESIRGIRCDRVIDGLEKKELITEVGRSSGIGRPILYGTTDVFLKNFGFTNLKELPDIEEIEEIMGAEGPADSLDLQQISLKLPEK